jgi:hypothetical protein
MAHFRCKSELETEEAMLVVLSVAVTEEDLLKGTKKRRSSSHVQLESGEVVGRK